MLIFDKYLINLQYLKKLVECKLIIDVEWYLKV